MPTIDYEENPIDDSVKRKFDNKDSSKFFDPCQEAANKSLKCLRRNMGDREMCTDYFQAYRDCKKKWIEERKSERWKKTLGSLGYKSEEKPNGSETADVVVSPVQAETPK